MINFSDIASATMTFQECRDYYAKDLWIIFLFLFILVFVLFGFSAYLVWQNNIHVSFIKEEKLQSRFQNWKKNNKGLN